MIKNPQNGLIDCKPYKGRGLLAGSNVQALSS
jgi:hypothetical protein